ncbi:MAG: hypothetical protein O3B45_02770 [Bacteroidetes bacterium]|nr:hypothetical protein [Bacteroidota bacterium]
MLIFFGLHNFLHASFDQGDVVITKQTLLDSLSGEDVDLGFASQLHF